MDNQQGKAQESDLHWLAGFIDGEGSIIMKRQGGSRLRAMNLDYYAPNIRICNTCEKTFDIVVDILKRHELPFHVTRRTPDNPNWKPSWDISVNGLKRCLHWLEVFLPYLRTKQDQAEWMREFIVERLTHDKQNGYSPREQELLALLRKREPVRPHRLNA